MLKGYIEAFKEFSKAKESEFEHKKMDWGVYFLWNGTTYIVRHYNDFRKEYKYYFEKESYDELDTQTDFRLWHHMLQEGIEIEVADFILEIYRQWRIYWSEMHFAKSIPDEKHFVKLKEDSWRDYQVFADAVKLKGVSEAVMVCMEIDDSLFVPLIALVIRNQYEDIEIFLDDCLEKIIEYGYEFLPMYDTYEIVYIETPGVEREEYFIYNDILEFQDLTSSPRKRNTQQHKKR